MFKAVKAIIRYKESFFLQLRDDNKNIPYPNRWAFFGGRLLLNENPKEGLIRELIEELEYHPKDSKKFYSWYNPETKTQILYYLIQTTEKIKFKNILEGQKGEWMGKNKLNIVPIAPDIREVKHLL